ncbi:MAG: hypothetical protein J6A75_00675 [Lachnospiraceae bacterium]|nr:hypothetical protein [Lachnospiraceae bacterium]
MGTIYIKNKRCSFCDSKLENGNVICPNGISIPLLECKACHVYYYKRHWYDMLQKMAKENNCKLNRDVYVFEEVLPKIKPSKKKKKNKQKPQNKQPKNPNGKKKSKSISELPAEKISTPKQPINIDIKSCNYYRKNYCIYNNDRCQPYSIRCKLRLSHMKLPSSVKTKSEEVFKTAALEHFVTAIVLTYNRKCIYEEHGLEYVIGVCKVARFNGTVGDVKFPASYCPVCNSYFVHKADFIKAKERGVLLCEVEDRTPQYLEKHKFSFIGNESRVHALGYNVSRQSNYTYNQRKLILANIIENYGINRFEILSIIDVNIARHKNQPNYSEAIRKWKMDREFVLNYKSGDCPEVIISRVVLRS